MTSSLIATAPLVESRNTTNLDLFLHPSVVNSMTSEHSLYMLPSIRFVEVVFESSPVPNCFFLNQIVQNF